MRGQPRADLNVDTGLQTRQARPLRQVTATSWGGAPPFCAGSGREDASQDLSCRALTRSHSVRGRWSRKGSGGHAGEREAGRNSRPPRGGSTGRVGGVAKGEPLQAKRPPTKVV